MHEFMTFVSWITVVWSMAAAACFTLGGVHLVIWSKQSRLPVHLLFSLMAVAAGFVGLSELLLLHEETIAGYHQIIRWQHLPIFTLLTSMVWAVHLNFGTGRRWLVWMISALWVVCLVINFASRYNLVYEDITDLHRVETFWGGFYTVVKGIKNPWTNLANFTSVLIIVFVADASVRLWLKGGRQRAGIIGGSILVFIVAAGIHSPMVDAGIVKTPYMISFAFLSIVGAMSYQLGSDAVRAGQLSLEVENNERRWRSLLEGVELLVLGVDPEGRVNYVNPHFESVTGFAAIDVLGKPAAELVIAEQTEELLGRMRGMVEEGPRPRSTWSFRCADGGSRTIVFSSVRLETSDGSFAGILSVGEDITDRLRAELTARDLAGKLIHAQEEERSRVARDLHDDITQRLARLSIDAAKVERAAMDTRFAETLKEMGEDLVRLSEDVHAIAYRLHPSALEDLGLSESLASECERFTQREGIRCEIKKHELPEQVARPVALGLFRVAQEALRNIGRHARAKSVKVTLRGIEDGVQLAVHDDGVGFDPSKGRTKPSMGLASMRERISYLGGELDIESSPGHGTTIVAWVPVEEGGKPS
jgi:PAS domain S-box-containing protein